MRKLERNKIENGYVGTWRFLFNYSAPFFPFPTLRSNPSSLSLFPPPARTKRVHWYFVFGGRYGVVLFNFLLDSWPLEILRLGNFAGELFSAKEQFLVFFFWGGGGGRTAGKQKKIVNQWLFTKINQTNHCECYCQLKVH